MSAKLPIGHGRACPVHPRRAKTRDAPEWSWLAGWKVGARPPNKNLEFPCFAQENAKSANICIHRPLNSFNNFYPPPNFRNFSLAVFGNIKGL
jgi:hypothetical protein